MRGGRKSVVPTRMVGYDDGAFALDVDPVVVVIVPHRHSVLEVDAMTVAGADDVMIVVVVIVIVIVIVVVVVVIVVVVVVVIVIALASFPIILAGNDVPIMMSR